MIESALPLSDLAYLLSGPAAVPFPRDSAPAGQPLLVCLIPLLFYFVRYATELPLNKFMLVQSPADMVLRPWSTAAGTDGLPVCVT